MNKGAHWITKNNEGTICVCSWRFYDVNNVVSEEYGIHFRIDDDILQRENWKNYRKKVPGLIAELEAAERIANEINAKYGVNIKLWARQKPFLETCFNSKGMCEDEKLREIEKHAKAMYETWGTWNEWATNVGREIYMKTTKKRMRREEFIEKSIGWLRDITGACYNDSYFDRVSVKMRPGTIWVVEGDSGDERNVVANRGVWLLKEIENNIIMMSDNLDTINARNIEEYRCIQQRMKKKVAVQMEERGFRETIISPELVERVVRRVEERFNVKIQLMKDRPVLVTSFNIGGLRPYGKLYEIEKHAKALAEAWNGIKEKVQNREIK